MAPYFFLNHTWVNKLVVPYDHYREEAFCQILPAVFLLAQGVELLEKQLTLFAVISRNLPYFKGVPNST